MANFVKISTLSWTGDHYETDKAVLRKRTIADLKRDLAAIEGCGVDMVLTSECVGYFAWIKDETESLEKPGELLTIYTDFARRNHCVVVGSIFLRENGAVHNSLLFVNVDGTILGVYHKNFLTFGPRSEIDFGVTPGSEIFLAKTPFGTIGGAICFDLNFADLRARYKQAKPDILCFASMYHGGLMQGIWAYDLRAFFVAALYFPNEPFGILDPFGRPVKFTSSYEPWIIQRVNLDRVMMHLTWNDIKFLEIRKKYGEEVVIDVPPSIGSALLYSNSPNRTALDIAKEFDLVLLDDFFAMAVEENGKRRKLKTRAP